LGPDCGTAIVNSISWLGLWIFTGPCAAATAATAATVQQELRVRMVRSRLPVSPSIHEPPSSGSGVSTCLVQLNPWAVAQVLSPMSLSFRTTILCAGGDDARAARWGGPPGLRAGILAGEALARAGSSQVRTWLDQRDTSADGDWSAAARSAIERADRFLSVVTPEETISPWVRRERQMALEHYSVSIWTTWKSGLAV
jgi:hypothetical protein